jgi:hypothetical protein
MITFNEHHLNEYTPRTPPGNNLTKPEREALLVLQNNTDIVIKPADKGSAVVIQNTTDYIKEGLRQRDNGEISDKCHTYLCNKQPRTPQLYLLPKIHKNKTPVPGRPIVSANNSPTERISQFVDHFLQPIVSTTKSYVKDTTDFLNKIEALEPLPENSILATVDVTSLYTNIPNQEGITACNSQLNKVRLTGDVPPTTSIIQLLEYVLTKNNFDFNAKHYLQVGGTAMGTKLAPSYANIFMADFEERFVYPYNPKPKIWLRYIDDIFLIWEHGQQSLDSFLEHLNSCHHSIKFTAENSTTAVNFLDTTVKVGTDNKLYTTLYCKPTDSHNYLLYESAHPKHTKSSLPYSQLLRIRRICSHIEDYDTNAVLIGSHFIKRGYPPHLVEEAIITVRRKDRGSLLCPSVRDNSENPEKLFIINTFTPNDQGLKHIVKHNWSILGRTHTTTHLHNHRLIFGHRRNKNLRDILVRARLPQMSPTKRDKTRPLHICSTYNCRYCPKIDHTGTIISTSTGKEYNTRKIVSCKSNNLIYCITCSKCKKQYVGQTKNRLQDRFVAHFYNIEHKKKNKTLNQDSSKPNKFDDPIGRHFKLSDHKGLQNVQIHILQFISAPSDSIPGQSLRDDWERRWIHRLKTISPMGLNSAD